MSVVFAQLPGTFQWEIGDVYDGDTEMGCVPHLPYTYMDDRR